MNAALEQKLKELVDDAERAGAPAVYMVLNLLLAAHSSGDHHKFAKHCCQFSPCAIELKTEVSNQSKPNIEQSKPNIEFDDGDSWDWDLGV